MSDQTNTMTEILRGVPEHALKHGSEHDAQVAKYWEQTGGDKLLKNHANFQELFFSIPDHKEAFILRDHNLRCMDEGTPGGIHMAGSGVLNPEYVYDLKDVISAVLSHEECGAVGVYMKDNHVEGNIDSIADHQAMEIAKNVGVPYLGRIPMAEMARPPKLHTARAVYYTGCEFDPEKIGLPIGFQVDAWVSHNVSYRQYEADLATKIAFGDHGFGARYTKESPLYLVAVTKKDGKLSEGILIDELKAVADNRPNIAIQSIVL